MEQYYTISINGQKAVDAARMILGQRSTKIIKVGKAYGLMKIFRDSEEVYNGCIQKWAEIYVKIREEADAIIAALPAMGFGGCEASLILVTPHGSFTDEAVVDNFFILEITTDASAEERLDPTQPRERTISDHADDDLSCASWSDLLGLLMEARKEREVLRLAAGGRVELCDTCKFRSDIGKPCEADIVVINCHTCGRCICGKCNDGDKWVWDGKER